MVFRGRNKMMNNLELIINNNNDDIVDADSSDSRAQEHVLGENHWEPISLPPGVERLSPADVHLAADTSDEASEERPHPPRTGEHEEDVHPPSPDMRAAAAHFREMMMLMEDDVDS